jgi:hypothetical protein
LSISPERTSFGGAGFVQVRKLCAFVVDDLFAVDDVEK